MLGLAAIVLLEQVLQTTLPNPRDSLLQTSKLSRALQRHASILEQQAPYVHAYPAYPQQQAYANQLPIAQAHPISTLPTLRAVSTAAGVQAPRLEGEEPAAPPAEPAPAAPAAPAYYAPPAPAAGPYPPQYPPAGYPPQQGQPYSPQQYPPQPYGAAGFYPPLPQAPQCFAAGQCLDTLEAGLSSAVAVRDKIQSLQIKCDVLTKMVQCMCGNCASTTESDPGFVSAHEQYCTPVLMAQYRLAGGACSGFASGYCGLKMDANFCENFAVPPVLGSEQWMKSHEIVDPGAAAATAGLNLFSNQLPQYAQKVSDAMTKYFTAAAVAQAAKARETEAVIEEMNSLSPNAGSAGESNAAAAIFGGGAANATAAGAPGWYCLGVFC